MCGRAREEMKIYATRGSKGEENLLNAFQSGRFDVILESPNGGNN